MARKYQTTADVEAAAARGEIGPRDTTRGWRRWGLIAFCVAGAILAVIGWALLFAGA